MLPAGLGILAALAFVLGLIALAVWVLKRVGAGTLGSKSRLPLEVVQRLPLGPKAGLAVVRVGEKVMVVSMGEGGVHALCDVDEADRQRVLAASPVAVPLASSEAATASFTRAFRRSAPVAAASAEPMRLMPFGEALASAVEAPVSAAVSGPIASPMPLRPAPRAEAPRAEAPRSAADRDLRAVLSMTLAPSTRLLSVALVAALAAFAPVTTVTAQGAPAVQPPVSEPLVVPALPPLNLPAVPAAVSSASDRAAATGATSAPSATPSRATRPAPVEAVAAQPATTADAAVAALVPQLDLRLGSGEDSELRLNGTVGVVLMMGLMTLVPTLLLMMTGFTRILIVLHFLKQAMGTQSAPPAHLVAGLALLLTGFVMAPTITEANRTAIQPWLKGEIQQVEMLKTGVQPFREFMLRQTNEKDLRTFVGMSRMEQPETPDDVPLHVLMSAFVASELRTAFQIGFAIYLPFIVIDAVVASVLMAMGMFMLPPAMISLPFKLLLFVLVDGWSLTIQSLVQSFR
jgi:flagellar biosynthetic protein FliP